MKYLLIVAMMLGAGTGWAGTCEECREWKGCIATLHGLDGKYIYDVKTWCVKNDMNVEIWYALPADDKVHVESAIRIPNPYRKKSDAPRAGKE